MVNTGGQETNRPISCSVCRYETSKPEHRLYLMWMEVKNLSVKKPRKKFIAVIHLHCQLMSTFFSPSVGLDGLEESQKLNHTVNR